MSTVSYGYLRGQLTKLRSDVEAFEAQQDVTDRALRSELLASKRRIYDLTVLLTTLVEALEASGHVDMEVLEARLDNRLADDGYSAERPEPTTTDRPYVCVGCYHAITISEGTMSPSGIRCPRCSR